MQESSVAGFDARIVAHAGVPVVAVTGEIDLHVVPEFRSVVSDPGARSAAGPGPVVLVDLAEVTFMDSSGVGVLIGQHRELEGEGGELRIVTGEGPALKILKLTSLDEVFSIFSSREDAMHELTGGGS
ncbi:MAG: STAS domain-containing protein [Rubrobacter sp.]|jgi:anti-sigma B factor antagonist|nr:STAS domain-containing protein [Rubrobacter sp.]